MKTLLALLLLIPSLSWGDLFKIEDFSCAGEIKNQIASGKAYCEKDKDKYYLNFNENLLEGLGFIEFDNGSKMLVEYASNQWDGYGIVSNAEEESWSLGEYKNNYLNGVVWKISKNHTYNYYYERLYRTIDGERDINSLVYDVFHPDAGSLTKIYLLDKEESCVEEKVGMVMLGHSRNFEFDNINATIGLLDENCEHNSYGFQLLNGERAASGKIVDGLVKRMDIWKIDSWVSEMNEYGMNLELFINDLAKFKNNATSDFFEKTKVFGLNNSSKDYFFDETALNIYEIYKPFITEHQNNY